jgi:hypothetical protein
VDDRPAERTGHGDHRGPAGVDAEAESDFGSGRHRFYIMPR